VRRTLFLALMTFFVLAAPAMGAGDDGEGVVGETNDKIVTFFSLGVIVFFVLVVAIGTILQTLLEKRKEEQKAARLRQRSGW